MFGVESSDPGLWHSMSEKFCCVFKCVHFNVFMLYNKFLCVWPNLV